MKITTDIKSLTTSQSNLAKAVGLSQPRISQLVCEGIVVRDDNDSNGGVKIFESLKNYYSCRAVFKENSHDKLDNEKVLLMKAKRELAELQLARAQEKLVDAKEVEKRLTSLMMNIRTKFLAMPEQVSAQLEGKSCEEIDEILTAVVEDTLETLGETSFEEDD